MNSWLPRIIPQKSSQLNLNQKVQYFCLVSKMNVCLMLWKILNTALSVPVKIRIQFTFKVVIIMALTAMHFSPMFTKQLDVVINCHTQSKQARVLYTNAA